MVIMSRLDTQLNKGYLPSESNPVMSTNRKVSQIVSCLLLCL